MVDELWRRARSSVPALLAVFAACEPAVAPLFGPHPAARVAYATSFVVLLLRWLFALALTPRLGRMPLVLRYGLYASWALAGAGSMAWLSFLAVHYLDPWRLGIWVIFVSGICGGSIMSLGSRLDIFFSYVGVMLAPLIVGPWLWPREGGTTVCIAASVWLVYSIVQVRQYFQTRKGLFVLTVRLDDKLTELDRKNRELEEKNVELEQKHAELLSLSERADRIFSALADALPGKTLAGRYHLEDRVGSGGFAVVFRARDLEHDRPVAVKIFRPEAGNATYAAFERFRQEAASHATLSHPNVVEVFDTGISEDGIAYIAMELLDGHTLAEELRRGPAQLDIPRALWIAAETCRALAGAHAQGLVHRDVKPENIFLHRSSGAEVVKLLDFGISKTNEAPNVRTNLTKSGMLVGTPHYMAPERLMYESGDASVDVYSVGVLLYRALGGRLPFEGNLVQVMMQATSQRPVSLAEIRPTLGTRLNALVMRTLDTTPSARPSAAELADELASLLGETSTVPTGAS